MNKFDEKWLKTYQFAKEYYENNDIKLGKWIHEQRIKYKNTLLEESKRDKKRGILSQERINLLESIGMVWENK